MTTNEATPTPRWATLLVVFLVGLYILSFGLAVSSDPLVRAPQLDGAEMVGLARAIDAGTLPPEPFFRSMGYPWLLSLIAGETTSDAGFGLRGLWFNLLAHGLNAALVGLIAKQLWRNRAAGLLAGALYGVYPVALHFAGQLFDVTWGITLFLASLYVLIRHRENIRWWFLPLAGLALGSAIVLRPHFLFTLPALVLMAFGVAAPNLLRRLALSLAFVGGVLAPLALQAWAGWSVSGEWRWLPWQGSYNLYAANAENANGRYFKQTVVVADRDAATNPARAESELRYLEETGTEPPTEIDAMSAYWKSQYVSGLRQNPSHALGLTVRKAAYALNDFEQYNNLTYDFHKARQPLLRWNPLGWGLLAVAAASILVLFPLGKKERLAGLAVVLCYSASLLLFYASARFRLPLAPLLAIAAGGWAILPVRLADLRESGRLPFAVGAALITAILVFSNPFQARDHSTHVQDALLLGNAATTTGDDALALDMAMQALDLDPTRDEARRLALVSYWNLRLIHPDQVPSPGNWEDVFTIWVQGNSFTAPDAPLAAALGTVLWHQGREAVARQIWSEAATRLPAQRAVLDQLLAVSDPASPAAIPALRELLVRTPSEE